MTNTIIKILALALGIAAATAFCGCTIEPAPVPIPPAPVPVPVPTPPEPPPVPADRYPASTFDGIEVGDPVTELETLPPFERLVKADGLDLYVWVLDEERDVGDFKRWEIHVRDGKIVASFPY